MKYRLTVITAALLLAACSIPPESGKTVSQPSNKETVKMSENKTPPEMQREVLTNLLEMMASSQSIKDFTVEHIEQNFGVKMIADESEKDSYYFFKELSTNWEWSLDKSKDPIEKQDGLRLSFNSINDDIDNYESLYIEEICGMDFDEFVQKAEKMGFTQEPNIVQDGMQMGVYLDKENLQVKVLPLYYNPKNNPDEQKACIRMILVG